MKFSWLEMIGGSLLLTVWVLYGANWIGNALTHVEPAPSSMSQAAALEATTPEAEAQGGEAMPETAPADLSDLLTAANADAGKKVFAKCKTCHDDAADGRNKSGPNLWNVVGASQAAVAGFKYSDALKGLGEIWTFENLDAFFTSPATYAPGTRMSFKGISKPEDRAAVIIYLHEQSDSPVPLP